MSDTQVWYQLTARDTYSALSVMCSLGFLNLMPGLPAATIDMVAQRSQPTHPKYQNQWPGMLPSPTQNAGEGKETICHAHSHLF